MVRRTFFLIGASSLAIFSPAVAQFGVPKKPGTNFEQLQEKAKNEMAAGGLDMDALAGMDLGEMQKMIQEAMADPKLMETMGQFNKGVNDAMAELSKMSPEELQKQMMEGLSALTSGDIMDTVMDKKDEVLETLAAQGLVDKAKIEEYRNDPELFEKEMKDSFAQMKDLFSDPDAVKVAADMMKGMSDILANPEQAMKELASSMSEALGDDDKIEEARLQLLANPEKAGSPLLAEMFKGDDMKEILRDPVKWRESVKKGQGMLIGEEGGGAAAAGVGQGAGVGEL